jgi:hypothetical protein
LTGSHYLGNLAIERKMAIKVILKRQGNCLKVFNAFISLKILPGARLLQTPTRGRELLDRPVDF